MSDETQKHTLGPWYFDRKIVAKINGHKHITWMIAGDGYGVAICIVPIEDKTEKVVEMVDANARLIASAPDLLDALESMLAVGMNIASTEGECGAAMSKARAAIAKATGATK